MKPKIATALTALALSGCVEAGSGLSRGEMAEEAAIRQIEDQGDFVGDFSVGSRRLIWLDRQKWIYCANVYGERRPAGWHFDYNDQVSGLVVVDGYGPVAFEARFRPGPLDFLDCRT